MSYSLVFLSMLEGLEPVSVQRILVMLSLTLLDLDRPVSIYPPWQRFLIIIGIIAVVTVPLVLTIYAMMKLLGKIYAKRRNKRE